MLLFLIISLLLSFVSPTNAQAAGNVTLSTQPASLNANVGETVTVSVTINPNGDSVSAAQIYLTYDPSVLDGQSVTAGSLFPVVLIPGTIGNGKAAIVLGSSPTSPVNGTGTVLTLTFKALKTGSSTIKFDGTTETVSVGKNGNTLGTTTGATINISSGVTVTPAPTKAASIPPVPTTMPSSTSPNPIVGRVTINFDDLKGQDNTLNGIYPAGRLNWGNNNWYLSSPWQKFDTKSVSFNGPVGVFEADLNLLTPGHLESVQVYNGGLLPSMVVLSCAGQKTVTTIVNPSIAPTTIQTGWTGICTNIIFSSSNGWYTNFDNLVIADPNTSPVMTPMPTLTPSPSSTAQLTINFDNIQFKNRILNGQLPSGVIDWGFNKWFLSGPWKKFNTKSISFANGGIKSAQFKFVAPKTLVSLKAYNGGNRSTNLSISCIGQQTKSLTLAAGQITTINTAWINPCSPVTIDSSNSWDTNFDELIVK